MPEDMNVREGDRDGEWTVSEEPDVEVEVIKSKTDINDPYREPESGETVQEYGPDVAKEHGIKNFAMKVGGTCISDGRDVYFGSDLAKTPVQELDGKLKIGKYSVLG